MSQINKTKRNTIPNPNPKLKLYTNWNKKKKKKACDQLTHKVAHCFFFYVRSFNYYSFCSVSRGE